MIVDAPPTRRAATGEAGLTALVGVFLMLQPLSTDLYLASLPGLATRFSVPASVAQLTLSLFVAGFGLMQLASGPMSDRWGRRPVVLAALALYVGASLACAAAPTIEVLIAARFLQAVGCCTVVVVARAIGRDAFDPAAGARVLARASSILAIGPIAGPIAGSVAFEVEKQAVPVKDNPVIVSGCQVLIDRDILGLDLPGRICRGRILTPPGKRVRQHPPSIGLPL